MKRAQLKERREGGREIERERERERGEREREREQAGKRRITNVMLSVLRFLSREPKTCQ